MELLAYSILLLGFFLATALSGYGMYLFVAESPYVKPLTEYIKNRQFSNKWLQKLQPIIVKGMSCATCLGFQGGFWFGLFVSLWLGLWTVWYAPVLFAVIPGLIGSGTSTALVYAMEYYWLLKERRDNNGGS